MSDLPIRPYERLPAAFHPWDPAAVDVARGVARLLAMARPGTVVEHVGRITGYATMMPFLGQPSQRATKT